MARSAILRHSVRLYGTTEPESIGQAVSSGSHPPVQSGHRRSHQPRPGRRAWDGGAGGDGGAGSTPTPQYAMANWNKTVRSQLYSRNPKWSRTI